MQIDGNHLKRAYVAGCAQYQRSLEALQVLSASADAAGRPIEVVKVPQPPVLRITEVEARGIKARALPYLVLKRISSRL